MKNEKNKTTLNKKIGTAEVVKIICKISEKGSVERLIFNSTTGEYESTGTGANNFLNDFLPKLQFIKTENSLKDVAKYGSKTEIGQMLSGVINEILASEDEEYKAFLNKFNDLFIGSNSKVSKELSKISEKVEFYLKKQFKECEKVSFEVQSPKFEDLLKNFETNVDDGHSTTAGEKGDGMQRALMLAIIQAYSEYRKNNENIKNFIFLIDEAELHLHPTAQRSLKSAFIDLADRGDQVILTSHSSVLIADEISNQKLFKVEKNDHITDITEIGRLDKPSVVYDLLGGSPSDLLLPRNFLLVEGSSDKMFIDLVIGRLYADKKQIQVIPVWGDVERSEKVFGHIDSIFSPLNKSLYADKVVILLDHINENNINAFSDFLRKYPELGARRENQIVELEVGSLEEYYPVAQGDQVGGHNQSILWRRERDHGLLCKQKQKLAKHVGNLITREQFEGEMSLIFAALNSCWESAY